MSSNKDLIFALEQTFADSIRQLVMVKSIKLINKDKWSIYHLFQLKILQLEIQRTC